MINHLPIIGWILSLLGKISLAFPFWICWTVAGLGEKYFYFMPNQYQNIGFWHSVGVFIIISILGTLIKALSPISINQTINNK